MRKLRRRKATLLAAIVFSIASLWFFWQRHDGNPFPKGSNESVTRRGSPAPLLLGNSREAGSSSADHGVATDVFRLGDSIGALFYQAPEGFAPEIIVVEPGPVEPGPFLQLGIRAVNDPDPRVRERLVVHLSTSQDERAVPFLTTALMDPEFHIRQLALDGLHRFGPRVPVRPLIEFVTNDTDPERRAQVLALIRELADPEADEILSLNPPKRERIRNVA